MSVPTPRTDWNDPVVRRFAAKVDVLPSGCWQWLGYVGSNGYGFFRHPDTGLAHRVSWMLHRGPIPEGLTIDHLCRKKDCVNPNHLEPVPGAVNTRRGARDWMACEKYHPSDPPRWAPRADGRTYCRECNRVREQARRDQAALRAADVAEVS